MVSSSGPAVTDSFVQGLREIFFRTLGRGVGYPVLALALVGCLVPSRLWSGLERRSGSRVKDAASGARAVLVVYVVAVLVVMSLLTVKRSTYLTPALPAIAVLAAAGLEAIFVSWKRPGKLAAATAAALLVVVLTGLPSVGFDRALKAVDTRTQAKQWVEENIVPGTVIALETYGPVLYPTNEQLSTLAAGSSTAVGSWEGPKRKLAELRLAVGQERSPQYELHAVDWWDEPFRLPDPWDEPEALLAELDARDVSYLILTSKAQQFRPMEGAEPPAIEAEWSFLEMLAERADLVIRFTDETDMPLIDRGPGRSFHNPVVEVYSLRDVETGADAVEGGER
jgi:hypothetical protein